MDDPHVSLASSSSRSSCPIDGAVRDDDELEGFAQARPTRSRIVRNVLEDRLALVVDGDDHGEHDVGSAGATFSPVWIEVPELNGPRLHGT